MSEVRYDWSMYYESMGRILRGSEMQSFVAAEGAKVAAGKNSEGGSEYAVRTYNSGQRQVGYVYPVKRRDK